MGQALWSRRIEDVCEIDTQAKPLGKGAFGAVWRAQLKGGGRRAVAVKVLEKRKMETMKVSPAQVYAEVELMRECAGQRRILQLHDFVDAELSYFLVLECCEGGSLERIAKEGCALGDGQVVRLARQLLEAIAFLHGRDICHRDVKPHNAMLLGKAPGEPPSLKLGDFGIAVRLPRGRLLKEKTGSPAFMAPEMHLLPGKSAGYDRGVDLWAAGAVVVFLFALQYAFVDESGRLMRDELLRGELPLWEGRAFGGLFRRVVGLSAQRPPAAARGLVRRLLAPNPHQRPTARAALEHEWFRQPQRPDSQRGPDDLPLLRWEDFRELVGLERQLPGVAAWVADTCGLEAMVQQAAAPLRAGRRARRLAVKF